MNTFIRILAILAIIMTVACAGGTDTGTGDTDDTGQTPTPGVWDVDGDGYCGQAYLDDSRCTRPAEYDCNDGNADIYPGNTEDCTNTIDDNCDGQVNEGCPCIQIVVYADEDGDGYGDGTKPETYCRDTAHNGYVTNDDDCDDTNAAINPGAGEVCGNDVDENCNGYAADCACTEVVYYHDADGDGYGDAGEPETFCQGDDHAGYVANDDDCDDTNAAISPNADEVCGNSVDENCDDLAPECDCIEVVRYEDTDGDGYGDATSPETFCEGWTHDGYVDDNTDCDDTDAARYPGAAGSNDCTAVVHVSTAAEFEAALAAAEPGDIITLAAGTYTGWFVVDKSGLPGLPIKITGPADGTAVLIGSQSGYRGALEIHHKEHVVVENLEITNPAGDLGVYLTGEGGNSRTGDGCANITLRNLYVHDIGDEGIKIRNLNTHDILIEHNRVQSTGGSGIDVQGAYPDSFPATAARPRKIIIRNNLIWDVGFAGIANEIGDQLHVYNNIVLGSGMGLDIGCGNHIVIKDNLITSYNHYKALRDGDAETSIDFDQVVQQPSHPTGSITCTDGIAVSGTYMTLIYDNEITDCNGEGDLIISYDHNISGMQHNPNDGHQYNLFFRNRIYDNNGYKTVTEFDKQEDVGARALNQVYYNNLFANNSAQKGIRFEHSVNLIFANNTMINGDKVSLVEESNQAIVKNNIFYDTPDPADVSVDGTCEGPDVSHNFVTNEDIFANTSSADYPLDATTVTGEETYAGADISAELENVFSRFDEKYDTDTYNWHDDFTTDIVFDYRKDFDGNLHPAYGYVGAYAVPQ